MFQGGVELDEQVPRDLGDNLRSRALLGMVLVLLLPPVRLLLVRARHVVRICTVAGRRDLRCSRLSRRNAAWTEDRFGSADVARALLLHALVDDEAGDLGRRSVDGAELEDVEQDDAAVVDEMLNGFAGEA